MSCCCFLRSFLFLSRLCHFWSFFPTQRVPFNSSKAGLVFMNSFSFCLSWKLFIFPSILNDSFAAWLCSFSQSACWIYHAAYFWPATFLGTGLQLTLCVHPCRLRTFCPWLLSEFSLYLFCFVSFTLIYLGVDLFCLGFEGSSLWLLDINACFLPPIREIVSYNLFK